MQATYEAYTRRVEARFYRGLVQRADGNVSEAARVAGLNRTFLHRKLKELEGELLG
jgi:DNA-binding NtrC family response regulator